MLGKNRLAARSPLGAVMATAVVCALSLGLAVPSAGARKVGTFQRRASSPKPVNNVVVDPTTNMIYAQQYHGTGFYRYNPRSNKWRKLAPAVITQGNNGGAAYLKGKIYTVYSENETEMGVYDIASGKWSMTANPLGVGTADITAVGGLLYLAATEQSSPFTPLFVSYNPATNTTKTLTQPPFDFSSWGGLAPYKGKIYGQEGDGDTPANFGAYDIATKKWKALPSGPNGMVLGAAIDPVTGTFYAYGSYEGYQWYRFDIATGKWLTPAFFPNRRNLDDGGMAYVAAQGLQGIYATYGQGSRGFTRYVTPRH